MVISGLFLIMLGTMIAYTFNSWQQSRKITTQMADLTYWDKRLRYELRTATTPPYITSDATFGPVEVDPVAGAFIRYQTLKTDINKFVLHKVSLSGQNNVIDQKWYSVQTFQPANTVYYDTSQSPEVEVLLKGVTKLQFYSIAVQNTMNLKTKNKAIEAYIENPLMVKGSSTTIKIRNVKCIPDNP